MTTGLKRPIKPRQAVLNGAHPIARGLVFDSLINERSGAKVRDLAGKLTGAITGAPVWQNDIYGTVLSFSGATDGVTYTVPAISKLESMTTFSYECMFNMTGLGGNSTGYIVCKSNAGPPYFLISCGASATLIQILAGYTTPGSWNVTIAENVMNHLVVNYTFGLTNNPVAWLNGQPVTVTNTVPALGTPQTDTAFLYIGNNNAGTRNWAGEIAYVRSWNRPLTYSEASQLNANPWCIYNVPRLGRQGL